MTDPVTKQILDLPSKIAADLTGNELLEIQDGAGVGSSKNVKLQDIADRARPEAHLLPYTPDGSTGSSVADVGDGLDAALAYQRAWQDYWGQGVLTRKTVTVNYAAGQVGSVVMAKSCLLLHVDFSDSMRFRLYATQAEGLADQSRDSSTVPPPGAGVLFEGLAVGILEWDCSPVPVIQSGEAVPTSSIFYILEPPVGLPASAGNVTLTYLVLEP
jgi:hypothetical protein